MKTLTDSATLTRLAAGIRWVAKKVIKESMTSDSSSNLINYVKFIAVIAASFAAKRYLDEQKILPYLKCSADLQLTQLSWQQSAQSLRLS